MGQVPKYTDELFRLLETNCIAVKTEKQLLEQSLGDTSLLKSGELRSNFQKRSWTDAILPAMAGIFAVVLVVLFALILADGGVAM